MRTLLIALAFMASPVWASPADDRLKAIYDAEWTWRMQEFVQVQDGLRSKSGDRFAGTSPADWERRKAYWQKVVRDLEAVPTADLSPEERLNKAVLAETLRANIESIAFRTYEAPLNSDSFFWGEVKPYSSLDGADDYRRYLKRLADVPRFFDENVANMRAGLKRGYTVPRVGLEGRDKTIVPFTKAGTENPLYEPFRAMPDAIPAAEQAAMRAEATRLIDMVAAPAYARLLTFMQKEYIPGARTGIAAIELPDGKAFYQSQIREFTTLDLTADEIHEIGLKEVARIDADMKKTIAQTGFKGSFAEFLQFLRTDPQFYARTPRELLGAASYAAKRMDGKLKDVFTTLPRYRFTILPVPDAIAPIYTSGRGGLTACLFNTYDLKSRPLYNLTALVLHECAPGHSHQGAMALEAPDRPAFRREANFFGLWRGLGALHRMARHQARHVRNAL